MVRFQSKIKGVPKEIVHKSIIPTLRELQKAKRKALKSAELKLTVFICTGFR